MKSKTLTKSLGLIALITLLTTITSAYPTAEEILDQYRQQYSERPSTDELLDQYRQQYEDRPTSDELLDQYREQYSDRPTADELLDQYRQEYSDRPTADDLLDQYREEYANRPSASEILQEAIESAGTNPSREEMLARIREQTADYPTRDEILSSYHEYFQNNRRCYCICTCDCQCTCPEPTTTTTRPHITTTTKPCSTTTTTKGTTSTTKPVCTTSTTKPVCTTTTRTTCPTTTTKPIDGRLRILKFNDHNGNGVYEPNQHEEKLAGFRFYVKGPKEYTVITDRNGEAVITGMPYGKYTIKEDVFDGWEATTENPQEIYIDCKGGQKEVRFGNRQVPAPAPTPVCSKLKIVKYNDENGNQRQDCGEEGLGGVKFTVVSVEESREGCGDKGDDGGSYSAKCHDEDETEHSITVVTNCSGEAVIECLPEGKYKVTEEVPSGWRPTTSSYQYVEVNSVIVKTLSFGNKKTEEGSGCSHLCYNRDCDEYRNTNYCRLYPGKCREYSDCKTKSYSGLTSCGAKASLECHSSD